MHQFSLGAGENPRLFRVFGGSKCEQIWIPVQNSFDVAGVPIEMRCKFEPKDQKRAVFW
jgi:hypothetical protein